MSDQTTNAPPAPSAERPADDAALRRPDEVRETIVGNQAAAINLRSEAKALFALEESVDRDAAVARALADSLQADHRALVARETAATQRQAEVVDDHSRWTKDHYAQLDKVNTLKRKLGEKVASDELMPPEGEPAPPPVAVETDPVQVETLRTQLREAEEVLATMRVADGPEPSSKADTRSDLVRESEARAKAQQARADALKAEAESLEQKSKAALEEARVLEAEAEKLQTDLPEIEKAWTAHLEADPPPVPTDLGELTITATARERAEAYAQGRREDAAAAEQEVAAESAALARVRDGARDRGALAAVREQEAKEIEQRLEASRARSESLQADGDAEFAQGEKMAAESDKLRADAQRQRDAGRTETADTLDARAEILLNESIDRVMRSGTLQNQASDERKAAAADQQRRFDLQQEAATLKAEQAELRAQADAHVQAVEAATARVAELDAKAVAVEQELDTGQPFTIQIEAADGTPIDLEVKAPEKDPGDEVVEAPPTPEPSALADAFAPGASASPSPPSTLVPPDPQPTPAEESTTMTEPTPLPRDHPDYRHPQATAPPEAILDADDLDKMRDKLRAGHNVVVGPTGHIQMSAEPVGPPMTAEAEAFIESRLGEVRRLALEGVSTRISPDGNMMGSGASGQVQHAMGPDKAFTADEIGIVENAILAGARVSIRPDGSVFTSTYPNDKPLTLEQREAQLVEFNQMRRSGDFQAILDRGESVQVFGGKIVHGVLDVPLPPPIEFPEPGAPGGVDPDVPPADGQPAARPGAAELQAEAAKLTAEAVAIRKDGEERVYNEVVQIGVERDAIARQKYGAEQQAAAAEQQIAREQRLAKEHQQTADAAKKAAAALQAKGDDIGAAEKLEEARDAQNLSEASAYRALAARDEGVKLRHEADDLGRKLSDREAAIAQAKARAERVDDAADGREDRARLLSSAAHNVSESERLMGEAAKMRADGDAEAAQLTENAAKYHRKLADDDWAKAEEVSVPLMDGLDDPTNLNPYRGRVPVFGMDDPVNPTGSDAVVAAADPDGTTTGGSSEGLEADANPIGDDQTAAVASAGDPNHIEMPEMDLSGVTVDAATADGGVAITGDDQALVEPDMGVPIDPDPAWPADSGGDESLAAAADPEPEPAPFDDSLG